MWTARGERELPLGEQWLTPQEADHAAGLRFAKRRVEFLLRRWVCKRAVASVLELSTEESSLARIEVGHRPSGAPFVTVDGAGPGLDVSLTDRSGWAVCVLSSANGPVGCDLEVVEPRSAGFVADFLTAREQAFVHSGDLPAHAAANLVWSAKESALKVLETGLRRDTRSVEVVVPPARTATHDLHSRWAPLEVHTAEGDRLAGWWRRDGVFLVTVAARGSLDPPRGLPGSADLVTAAPRHSWLHRPLST